MYKHIKYLCLALTLALPLASVAAPVRDKPAPAPEVTCPKDITAQIGNLKDTLKNQLEGAAKAKANGNKDRYMNKTAKAKKTQAKIDELTRTHCK